MYNVYKKRIIYVFMTLFVCVLYVTMGNLKDMRKDKLIATNSTPATNKTVIIDAGHGLPDEGAVRILFYY